MKRLLILIYGLVAYFTFFVTLLYMIAFVGNFWVPKSIDTGIADSSIKAILINLFLVFLFAIQHTIMARPSFKRWWLKYVPTEIERSTYVLFSSLLLILLFWQWQPLTTTVWEVKSTIVKVVIYALFALGWVLVFLSSFLINHFDLFGLRQVVLCWKGKDYTPVEFKESFLYKIVRHPLMLGFLIAFWTTPLMTTGHLLFAIAMTLYTFIGIWFEEKTLMAELGDDYIEYKEKTPMLFPLPNSLKSKCPIKNLFNF